MPPKRKVRGPNLSKVVERSPTRSESTDEFLNTRRMVDLDPNLIREARDATLENEGDPNKPWSEKRVRKLVVDAFRLTFQSRGNINQDISLATHKLLKAHTRAQVLNVDGITTNLGAFYNEFDIRLAMMLDEVSVVEHRARVFKMVSMAAKEIRKSEEIDHFMDFLLPFLKQWAMSDNVAARINTANLVSYILETGISKTKPPSPDKFCGYSLETSEHMFNHLKRSLMDREYQARVPAIRGMACLQEQPIPSNWGDEAKSSSPRELLMRSFRDSSWECRLTAMQSFSPKEGDVLILSDIILYDKCLKVRLSALEKFGGVRPNRYVKAKVHVLDLSLKDHEVSVRDKAKEVLKNWVKKLSEKWTETQKQDCFDEIIEVDANNDLVKSQEKKSKGYILAGQALVLLWLSDVPETVEAHATLKRIVTHLLDVIRKMYMCHQEPINAFAETLMNDLREKMMATAVPIITKSTISYILDTSEMALTQDAKTNRALVFFWRCLVEYVAERKRSEGDRTTALMRFLCPMKTMVENIIRILHRVKDLETDEDYRESTSTENLYIIQMSFVENLLLVMRYTERDQAGLDAYQSLLISMMVNPCYQKKIVDLVISELSQFYSECPDDMFSMIYSKINMMRRLFKEGKIPSMEESVVVGERRTLHEYGCESIVKLGKKIPEKVGSDIMNTYELMVMNAALKVGILKEWGDEYDDRYIKKFEDGISSKDLTCKILAIECVGIVGMYEFSRMEDIIGELIENFELEDDDVKAAILTTFSDLVIHNGLNVVDKVVIKRCRQQSIVSILTDIIMTEERSKESNLLLKSVEAMAKIMLQVIVDPSSILWQKAVLAMMFRASFAITDGFSARIRSTIIIMMKFFCSLTRINQLLVVKSFPRFFEMWASTSNTTLLSPNIQEHIPKLKRCAAAFVALTRHSALPKAEQSKTAAHIELVNDILEVVTGSADSASVVYYLHSLQCIDYKSFPRLVLNKIYQDLVDYIAVHEDDTDRYNYNELRKVSKRVAKILGINEDEDELEEIPVKEPKKPKRVVPMEVDDIDEGPSTSTHTQTIRKPRAPRQGPAPADALDIMQSPQRNPRKPPSRPTTASRPPTATTSVSRTAPPRSARRLRSDK